MLYNNQSCKRYYLASYKRLKDYRCGSVLEPRLHYYYPFKNIKKADNLVKKVLDKYNVKRENCE